MRALATLVVGAAGPAAIAGGLFDAVHGGTTATRSVAYALWIAAALCLALMAAAGTQRAWRRLDVPPGWVFVSAAVVLTVLGAAVDAAG
jgi:hypothetical protein